MQRGRVCGDVFKGMKNPKLKCIWLTFSSLVIRTRENWSLYRDNLLKRSAVALLSSQSFINRFPLNMKTESCLIESKPESIYHTVHYHSDLNNRKPFQMMMLSEDLWGNGNCARRGNSCYWSTKSVPVWELELIRKAPPNQNRGIHDVFQPSDKCSEPSTAWEHDGGE